MADTLLILGICITQFALGYMGVHVSLKPPDKEHHKFWIAVFVCVGMFGIGLTGWLAQRASNAQERANGEIHKAQVAATKANEAATSANNSALEAQKEVKTARDEARSAKEELTRLIGRTSKETTTAILKLGAEPKRQSRPLVRSLRHHGESRRRIARS